MTAVELLSHPFAQRLTWTLAHFVWQGLLIAVVLAIVVEVLRPRSVHVRYALSLAALVAMLAAVPLTWVAIGDEFAVVAGQAVATEVVALQPAEELVPLDFSAAATSWWVVAQPILFCAWLAGFLLLSVRLFVGWFATQALLRSRVALPSEVAASLARVGWRLQTSIPRVVFASEQVSQAIAVGFIRPLVLLPSAWLLELPPNLLEAVVAHELAHLRRCDLWVNFLQRVAEALLFYHPAIWWLSARLRRERELCCDALAVSATGERLLYAEALEITARWATVDGRPALSAGFFGEGKMNLLHRVRCVLGMSHERPASLWPASLLLGGLSFALLAAIYSAGIATVSADDERPAAKKEGERREGGDRPAVREGDRPREGEVRREGDRPRPEGEVRRDGDRPRPEGAPRDGERRPDARPDSRPDARPDARPDSRPDARPDARRPDAPRPDAPRDGEARRPAAGGENAELMAVIRQLRAEVNELRAEVARLRGGDAARRPAGGGDIRVEPRREGDRPRPDAERPREGGDRPRPEAGRREGGDRPNPMPDRPRPEGERREGGDRPKAEGDRK